MIDFVLFWVLSGFFGTIVSIVVLLFTPFSAQKFTGNEITRITKQVTKATIWNNGTPEGFMLGKFFIAYLGYSPVSTNNGPEKELFVIGWTTSQNNNINGLPVRGLHVYNREGAFFNLRYKKSARLQELLPKEVIERDQQARIIDSIIEHYETNSYAVVLLTGEPLTGKSTIPFLLARRLIENYGLDAVSFTDSFCPSDPNDSFSSLYELVSPTEKSPLIVVLEEIDVLFYNVVHQKIAPHEYFPIMVRTKPDWNGFLDKFDRKRFPFVIIIMTTNKNMQFFDELDRSMMRDVRVGLKFEL